MGAIYGFTGRPDRELLGRMARVLAHRGAGGEGSAQWRERPGATVGYLPQLAEPHALKRGAGLHTDGERVAAVAGYIRSGPQDLLVAYEERGEALFDELRGAFVLALLDGERLFLCRDGAGVRTIYHGRHDGRLLFAVEPKGVLCAPGFPRRVRPAAVAQYLTFSFVPGGDTMLEGLHELPAGHVAASASGAAPHLRRFFRFEEASSGADGQGIGASPPEGESSAGGADGWTGAPPRPSRPGAAVPSEAEWVARFRRAHGAAVRDRLPAGEPVGVFLSGGIDSSIVTAEVARQHDGPVRTYAIHFGDRYPDELAFARAVARRCGTDHEEVLVRPQDFLPRLRRLIWHLDDPIGDPITAPNFEVAARARRDVRWVFNGEGGDPCFGGPKNLTMMLHHWYGGIDREPGFRERRYLASYRRAYEEIDRLLAPAWRAGVDYGRDLEGVLRPFFEAREPRSFLDKLMAINIRLKGAHLILPKVNRMMGAHGLTPFAPLFDERVVELSFAMPGTMKVRGGIEKYVLKRAYERDLPAEVIARPKSGMRVPVHYWFRGELKRYARKILSPRNVRRVGIFDPDRVKQLLDYDTEEGPGRYGLRLWMLLSFEIWRRIVVDGEAP